MDLHKLQECLILLESLRGKKKGYLGVPDIAPVNYNSSF